MDLPEYIIRFLAEDLIDNPQITSADLKDHLKNKFLKRKVKEKIENFIRQYVHKNPDLKGIVKQSKEPLDFIQNAQITWEKIIFHSLNEMCKELKIALSRKRSLLEQEQMMAKWADLEIEKKTLETIVPVYSPRDLIYTLIRMRNPNTCQISYAGDDWGAATEWGDIKVSLRVKDTKLLKEEFEKLATNFKHLSIDDHTQERMILSQRVLEAFHVPLAKELAKQGCPQHYRAKIWTLILGVEPSDTSRLQFEQLKASVIQDDLFVDNLVYREVNLIASNDNQYFVFENLLHQILLIFSRDSQILEHFEYSNAKPSKAYLHKPKASNKTIVSYPPSGIIMFHGFSMFLCPLCHVYEDPGTLYMVFRELYTRYFYLLHNISSHPQGILSLCLLFENLLHKFDPELAFYLASKGIKSLGVVGKWLMNAFSGHLSSAQTLLLWDRIIAYDSLDILAVLAVAIVIFRRPILQKAESQREFESMLADISGIKAITLLQAILSDNIK